jgi:uncharacterized membrane protein YeaQ/YmgE (transglycosylase-associated protein family)
MLPIVVCAGSPCEPHSLSENLMMISIVGWLAVGLLVGFIARKMVDLRGDDPRLGIAVACGGAIVAGVVYTLISGAGVSAFSVRSMLWAAIGAAAGAWGWHTVRSRYVPRAAYTSRRSY